MPAFEVVDSNGIVVDSRELADTIVVFEWADLACPEVKRYYQAGLISALQIHYKRQHIAWITVMPKKMQEATSLNQSLYSYQARPTHLVLDAFEHMVKKFEVTQVPQFLIYDQKGKLAYRGRLDASEGDSPQSMRDAEAYVADVLDDLLVGRTIRYQKPLQQGCPIQ